MLQGAQAQREVAPADDWRDVLRRCRAWLKYQGASLTDEPRVKVASYSTGSSGAVPPSENIIYLPALREAQLHWAAKTLCTPMRIELAFRRRTEESDHALRRFLSREHGDEWRSWQQRHAFQPFARLMEQIACEMAARLGVDPL